MFTREDARYRDVEMTLATHTYRGRSIGSVETCHQFPGHDMMFDVGRASLSSTVIPNVFITHGHDDHIGGIGAHHLRRNGWGLDPARYFVQEQDVPLVRDLVRVQCALNRTKGLAAIEVVPVGIGSEVPVGNAGYVVRPFQSTHRIPCLGYAAWSKRRKLRPEFHGASPEVLIAAKSRGETINVEVEVPEIAFPGDTNLKILDRDAGEVVRKARLLLLECTFVDDEVTVAEARKTGHIHLDEIIAAARDGAFENEVILLTHFSARYRTEYVRDVVTRKLSNEEIGRRVKLLLPEPRV